MSSDKQKVDFIASESGFSQSLAGGYTTTPIVVELFANEALQLPFHIRTGQQCLDDIAERKVFKYVEFHGNGQNPGTLRVRIYIDGRYICDGKVTLSESPTKHRKVNLPIGKRIGYTIDVEAAGSASLRAIEFTHDGMHSQS